MSESLTERHHEGQILDRVNRYDVLDCTTCGFKHVLPLPDRSEIESLYRGGYYGIEKPKYFDHQQEDLDWWNRVYGERYETFEHVLEPGRRRLLDVGSGPGHFIMLGQRRGWSVLGVEPSLQAAEYSRAMGLEIVGTFLDDASAAQLGSFDVVHMHEVLEHIPDPISLLDTSRKLLRPGGLLCVIAPNDYNPLQEVLRSARGFAPWWVAPPHHLNYFDTVSLPRLLARRGFEVLEVTTTFPIELFLLMGENYVGNDDLGRRVHGRRKAMELAMWEAGRSDLRRRLYACWAGLGIGREVVVIARHTADA